MCGVGTVLQGHANSLFITLRVSTSTIFTPHGQHPLAPSPPHHPPSPQLLCLQNLHHHPLQHNAKFATLIVSLSLSLSLIQKHIHMHTHTPFSSMNPPISLSPSFLPSFGGKHSCPNFFLSILLRLLPPENPSGQRMQGRPVKGASSAAVSRWQAEAGVEPSRAAFSLPVFINIVTGCHSQSRWSLYNAVTTNECKISGFRHRPPTVVTEGT